MPTYGETSYAIPKCYGKASPRLCQSIADLAKRLCREDVNSSLLSEFTAGRLIPLKKGDDGTGLRPIGVGEILRRIVAKAVGRVVKADMIQATGCLQTCSGMSGGIEASIHSMALAFSNQESEVVLLVDAENAFNCLNRKVALANIKSICPSYHKYLSNTYKTPSNLYVNNSAEVILSQEGTTQGDPDAMDMYGLSTKDFIDKLANAKSPEDFLSQVWYADDSCAAGKLISIRKWFDNLCEWGPGYGYFPKPSKCTLIVKNPEQLKEAHEIFKGLAINITTDGDRHLGAVIGSTNFKHQYVNEKISAWINDVNKELSEIAKEEPQSAYIAYTHGLCRRWSYVQRTIPEISELFIPLEEALRDVFIPSLLGRNINALERRICALPVRYGGLGIQDPTRTADFEYAASVEITKSLTDLILRQVNSLEEYDEQAVAEVKKKVKSEKELRFKEEYKQIEKEVEPLTKRSLLAAQQKGASSWLTALPLSHLGFILNKQEFRDALKL